MLNKATNSSQHIYMLAGSCISSAISKYQNGIQCITMVPELLSWYCGAYLVESYCKESNISDTNSPSIIFEQSLVECMTSSLG